MFELSITGVTFDEFKESLTEAYKNICTSAGATAPAPTPSEVEKEPARAEAAEEIPQDEPSPDKPTAPEPMQPTTSSPAQVQPLSSKEEQDNRGMVWDERIHSSTKVFNKDGTWRNKRGIDKNYLKEVEAELLGQTPPPVVTPSPAPPPPVEPTPPVQTEVVELPKQELAPPPPVHSGNGYTFDQFRGDVTGVISKLVADGKIDQGYVEQLNQHFEVNEIWEVFEDEQKVKELYENFIEFGLIERVS